MPDPSPRNLTGIAYMAMATAAGIITSTVIKTLAVEATILTVLSIRFVFSIPPLALVAWLMRHGEMLDITRKDRLAFRICIGHMGIIFWVLSLAHTSLGQATALFQSSAIFVTIFAPLMLRERVGIYRGGAVIAGIIGIYLMTNPQAGGFNIGSVYGIASAIAGAFLTISLRLLGRTEEPVSVALWHNGVGAVIYPIGVLVMAEAGVFAGTVMDNAALAVLLGFAACFVQIGFTAAYRYGEAVVLVPVRYLSVPVAGAIGWAFWDEALTGGEISGMVIVVVSCIFISVREYILGRRKNETA